MGNKKFKRFYSLSKDIVHCELFNFHFCGKKFFSRFVVETSLRSNLVRHDFPVFDLLLATKYQAVKKIYRCPHHREFAGGSHY